MINTLRSGKTQLCYPSIYAFFIVHHEHCFADTFQIQQEQKKKEEGKRTRMEKEQVVDVLLRAFEKHQYYNVKDLVTITKQPIVSTPALLLFCCLTCLF